MGPNALQKLEGTAVAVLLDALAAHTQLEEFAALCRDLGEPQDTIALAWVASNPAVTAPIIGPRTLEQFETALKCLDVTLDEAVLKRLDEIFPGPGGHAPNAYAW